MKALFITFSAILFAGAVYSATPDQLYAAGRQAFTQADYEKAADLFEQAAKIKPQDSNLQLWLFRAYGQQARNASIFRQPGLASKAKDAVERAIQLDPNNLDARSDSIEYYLQAPGFMGGGEDKALAQAQEIKKRDALAGHRAYARIYIHQKNLDLAKKEYYEAIREQPNSAEAHHALATYLISQKSWSDALAELDAAIRLDPTYMPAVFRVGMVAALSGTNYARGEESLKKYLSYKPDDDEPPVARAWYWLGQIQEKTGRKAEAKQSYTTSLKLMPGNKDATEGLKRVS